MRQLTGKNDEEHSRSIHASQPGGSWHTSQTSLEVQTHIFKQKTSEDEGLFFTPSGIIKELKVSELFLSWAISLFLLSPLHPILRLAKKKLVSKSTATIIDAGNQITSI